MRHPSTIVAAVVAILLAGPLESRCVCAEQATMPGDCPGYRAALLSARTYVERGDRPHALAALRRARKALQSCLREEATQRGLLADLNLQAPAS